MANLFLSFGRSAGETVAGGGVAGNNANDATTFANRVMDITSGITAARHAPGDIIRIMKSEDPVSLGINGTWTNKSNVLTLASALTTNIYLDGAWTASTNVTCTTSTTRKEGSNSASNAIATAFTTGKAAYYATGTLDLSSYNKISFNIRSSLSLAAGVLRIDLCSDTAGATPVNSLTIADNLVINAWKSIVIDNGAALGASIKSIALYCVSDPGAATILIDNVIACNALDLTVLVGKDSSATSKLFYPIQSINGTTVKLDYSASSGAADTIAGFYGTSETVTVYKRAPIRILSSSGQIVQEGGSASARSKYSGGWNTSDMTTQDGLTFIDIGDVAQNGLSSTQGYTDLERIIIVRGSAGIVHNGVLSDLTDCGSIGKGSASLQGGGIHLGGTNIYANTITNCYVGNGAGYGITTALGYSLSLLVGCVTNNCQTGGLYDNSGCSSLRIVDHVANNNLSYGVHTIGSGGSFYKNLTAKDAAIGFFLETGFNRINGITSSGNSSMGVSSTRGLLLIDDANCTDTTPFSCGTAGRLQISRVGGDPTVFRIYEADSNKIVAQYDTGTVHGSTTRSIKHSPRSLHKAAFPFVHALGSFAIDSTGTLTVSVYVRRSDSTNVGASLVVRGGQVDGVASDLTDTASAASNTWELLQVTCSPTEKVMLEVELHSWQIAGAGDVFWGDFDPVSQ